MLIKPRNLGRLGRYLGNFSNTEIHFRDDLNLQVKLTYGLLSCCFSSTLTVFIVSVQAACCILVALTSDVSFHLYWLSQVKSGSSQHLPFCVSAMSSSRPNLKWLFAAQRYWEVEETSRGLAKWEVVGVGGLCFREIETFVSSYLSRSQPGHVVNDWAMHCCCHVLPHHRLQRKGAKKFCTETSNAETDR